MLRKKKTRYDQYEKFKRQRDVYIYIHSRETHGDARRLYAHANSRAREHEKRRAIRVTDEKTRRKAKKGGRENTQERERERDRRGEKGLRSREHIRSFPRQLVCARIRVSETGLHGVKHMQTRVVHKGECNV